MAERIFHMIAVSNGCCTYFTSLRTLADDLKAVKPTIMASAPRLWENLYLRIMKNVRESHWIRRGLFRAAYFSSRMVKGSVFLREYGELVVDAARTLGAGGPQGTGIPQRG